MTTKLYWLFDIACANAILRRPQLSFRLSSRSNERGTMVVDRMAHEWARTDPILAGYSPGRHQTKRAGETRETPLDHRTRLPGVETRAGIGALRRSRLARISSSRHLVHRRLRLPGCGKKPFPPLTPRQSIGPTRPKNSIPISSPGLAASAPSVITRTPSQHYEFRWPGISPGIFPAAHCVAADAYDYL